MKLDTPPRPTDGERYALEALARSESDLAALRAAVEALAGRCQIKAESYEEPYRSDLLGRAEALLALLPGGDGASREGGR